MKILASAACGALFLASAAGAQTAPLPAPAPAQPAATAVAATPTVGATVYDSAGAVLGTIQQVTPQAVVIDVGGKPAALAPSAVGSGLRGLQVAITRAEVEAQTNQAQGANLQQQLVAGAQVRGAAGAVVGTVKSSTAQTVTITTLKGDAQLPVTGFAAGPNGPVIGLTAAQLDAAMTQAGAAAPGAGKSDASAAADEPAAAAPKTTRTTTTTKTKRTDR